MSTGQAGEGSRRVGSGPTERSTEERQAQRLATLFDLRAFIGALFLIFGVVVTIEGLVADQADIDKAAGVHLSLWTGLAMLVVGGLFLLWLVLAPPDLPKRTDDLAEAPDRH